MHGFGVRSSPFISLLNIRHSTVDRSLPRRRIISAHPCRWVSIRGFEQTAANKRAQRIGTESTELNKIHSVNSLASRSLGEGCCSFCRTASVSSVVIKPGETLFQLSGAELPGAARQKAKPLGPAASELGNERVSIQPKTRNHPARICN